MLFENVLPSAMFKANAAPLDTSTTLLSLMEPFVPSPMTIIPCITFVVPV